MTFQSIETLQFSANNPIEDKMTYKQLISLPAHCVSIFDGHGGPALAEYAGTKVSELIDAYLLTHL